MPFEAASLFILCGIALAFMAFAGTMMWVDLRTRAPSK
jgi:hypothetical protein